MSHTRIPDITLLEIVEDIKKVTPGTAITVTRKRHCSKIHAAGFCDSQCEETCGDTIRKTFQDIHEATGVKNYPGLFTWITRVNAADLIEEMTEADKQEPKQKKDKWGKPKTETEDAFGVLGELYN